MGKLMRIGLEARLPATTPSVAEMQVEAALYERFKTRTLALGLTETFREICDLQRATAICCEPPEHYPDVMAELGRAELPGRGPIFLFAGGGIAHFSRTPPNLAEYPNGTASVWLSSKLKWAILKVVEDKWLVVATGEKPDTAYEKIQTSLRD